MRRSRTSAVVVLLKFLSLFALWLSVSPAVQGQEEFPAPTEEQEKGVLLTDSLRRLAYDPARNGPLCAVALPTDRTRKETRSLRSLAEIFGRKIVAVGNLTVLAPREMVVLTVPTGKPDTAKDFPPDDAFVFLLDSLTDAQISALSGPGLGRADLTKEQFPLFDALFPKPVKAKLSRMRREDGVRTIEPDDADAKDTIFAPAELRMRLVRQTRLRLDAANGGASYYLTGDEPTKTEEETFWEKTFDSFDKDDKPAESAFGRKIVPAVPSRLKPSELDYRDAALNAPVALSAQWKTLGETIAHVADATGLELYADRRIAQLPAVWRVTPSGPSGQAARAGDVLEALAWSVTGAFRRLGPHTFLLTDDIEGIGTRQERLSQWATEAQKIRSEREFKARVRIGKRRLLSHLPLADDATAKLAAPLKSRLSPANNPGGTEFSSEELPAELREFVNAEAENMEKNDRSVMLSRKKLTISTAPVLIFLAPDGKRIRDGGNEFGGMTLRLSMVQDTGDTPAPPAPVDAEPLTPMSINPKVRQRVLIARLAEEKDAAPLVREAKKRGFTKLWLSQTLINAPTNGDADFAPLRAAIAEGEKAGLPVGAIVSLWKDTGEIPGGESDLDIMGRTDDETAPGTYWTAPTETAAAEIARRVARLAAVPGLRGLAIQYAFARGYYTERLDAGYVNPLLEYQRGYIASFRLSFVRAQQIDPVDMPPNPSGKGPLPFFPEDALNDTLKLVEGRPVRDDSQPGAAWSWRRFREKKSLAALAAVFAAVRKVAPKLPLYQSERLTDIGEKAPGFFAEWNAPDKIIRRPRFGGLPDDMSAVREVSSAALIYLSPYAYGPPNKFPATIQDKTTFLSSAQILFGFAQSADGAVIDLSPLPPADALQWLRECFAAP